MNLSLRKAAQSSALCCSASAIATSKSLVPSRLGPRRPETMPLWYLSCKLIQLVNATDVVSGECVDRSILPNGSRISLLDFPRLRRWSEIERASNCYRQNNNLMLLLHISMVISPEQGYRFREVHWVSRHISYELSLSLIQRKQRISVLHICCVNKQLD